MRNSKMRHTYSYDHTKTKNEENNMPSLTTPDMAMSAQEILHRFSQNRSVPRTRLMSFTGTEYLPDVRTLDLVEQEELLESNKARIEALEEEIKDKRKQRKLNLLAKKKSVANASSGEEITEVEPVD